MNEEKVPELLRCKLCEYTGKSLHVHIRKIHKISTKEYLELYPNEKLQLTSKETINKRNNSRKYGKPKIIEKLCICGCNKVFKCKEDSRQKYIRGHNKGRKGKGPTKGTYQKGHLVLNITKNKQSKAKSGKSHIEIFGEEEAKRRSEFASNLFKRLHKENKINTFAKNPLFRDKNPSWQGGKSFELYGFEWNKQLREQIRQRDNYTCQECNMSEIELNYALSVHHIDYNKKNSNQENLVSLCKSCHSQTNFDRNDWIEYYKNKVEERNGR